MGFWIFPSATYSQLDLAEADCCGRACQIARNVRFTPTHLEDRRFQFSPTTVLCMEWDVALQLHPTRLKKSLRLTGTIYRMNNRKWWGNDLHILVVDQSKLLNQLISWHGPRRQPANSRTGDTGNSWASWDSRKICWSWNSFVKLSNFYFSVGLNWGFMR